MISSTLNRTKALTAITLWQKMLLSTLKLFCNSMLVIRAGHATTLPRQPDHVFWHNNY